MQETLDLTKPIELGYVCKVCKTIFFKTYHIKEIIAKRLKKGKFDIENPDLTVAGMSLPRIKYCSPECRSNRK